MLARLALRRVSRAAGAAAAAAAPLRRAAAVSARAGVRHYNRPTLGVAELPPAVNEPFLDYKPGSPERAKLAAALERMKKQAPVDIPCVVGGVEMRSGNVKKQLNPSNHSHVVATYHGATEDITKQAIANALEQRTKWASMPWNDRAAVFLKAADLLSTKYRADLCAAVMLGSGKNVWQAEIDAAVEVIDFWRFNVKFAAELYASQPPAHAKFTWNRSEYRPLEGFVFAVSPFNFAAIGAQLPSTPAMLGNVVLWKPASTSVYANYLTYQILQEAGLPPGVINFLPGEGRVVSPPVLNSPDLSGLSFTGSTATFNTIWRSIGNNLEKYRTYPRIVGETGGKNFHFAHSSADVENFVNNTLRSAFEYQGQKCSACSRAYVPDNLWPQVERRLKEEVSKIKLGQPEDFDTFMCGVIDANSFKNIKSYIAKAKANPQCSILTGGECDDSKGYFVQPTIIVSKDPKSVTMCEEIFGPVLTIHVYPAAQYEQTLKLCNETSPYALTGALFARDRYALERGADLLRDAAGNFYLNDKSTGAVVGQQPFGGARQSGTNDKAGSAAFLHRWVSARTIKESFLPISSWDYPHMQK